MDMGNQHTVVGSVDTTADSIAVVVVAALQKSLLPDKVRSNRKQNRITHLPTQNGNRQVKQLETTSIRKKLTCWVVLLVGEVLVEFWLLLMEARACRAFSHSGFSWTLLPPLELLPYGLWMTGLMWCYLKSTAPIQTKLTKTEISL